MSRRDPSDLSSGRGRCEKKLHQQSQKTVQLFFFCVWLLVQFFFNAPFFWQRDECCGAVRAVRRLAPQCLAAPQIGRVGADHGRG